MLNIAIDVSLQPTQLLYSQHRKPTAHTNRSKFTASCSLATHLVCKLALAGQIDDFGLGTER